MELTLIDFKKHARLNVDLKGNTEVCGINGAGKTAILEGVFFALYGRDYYGNIAVDHYVRKTALSTTAILELPGFSVKRSAGGGENSVYLNGVKEKTTDMLSRLPPLEVALPVLNPLYFIYEMADLEKRVLFMKLFPQRSRTEIFKKKYSEDADLVERFRTSDIDNLKKQRRSLETTIAVNSSSVQGYEAQLISLRESVKTLQGDIGRAPRGVLNKEKETQQEINEIEERLAKMGDIPVLEKESKLALRNLADSIQPLLERHGKEKISELTSELQGVIETKGSDGEELTKKIQDLELQKGQYEKFSSGVCPVCGGDVSESLLKVEELAEEIKDLRETYESNSSSLARIKEAYEEVRGVDREASSLKTDLSRARKRMSEYQRLVKKKDVLGATLTGLTEEEFRQAVDVEAKRSHLARLKKEVKKTENEIERTVRSRESSEEELKVVQLLVEASSPQGVDAEIAVGVASELQEDVSSILGGDSVEIHTIRRNKTNSNVKEVFEVLVNGVRFKSLSFGEKIRVAVAFGLVARNRVDSFPFNFILLDEASVLSEDTKQRLYSMLGDVSMVSTVATSDRELSVRKI